MPEAGDVNGAVRNAGVHAVAALGEGEIVNHADLAFLPLLRHSSDGTHPERMAGEVGEAGMRPGFLQRAHVVGDDLRDLEVVDLRNLVVGGGARRVPVSLEFNVDTEFDAVKDPFGGIWEQLTVGGSAAVAGG